MYRVANLPEPALLSMDCDEDSRPKFKTSSPVEYVSMSVKKRILCT